MSLNPSSSWSPTDYAANAAFVPALGAPALELLDPKAGEMILDIGCGDGVLTQRIIAAGARRRRLRRRRPGARSRKPGGPLRPVRRRFLQRGPALDARSGRRRLGRLRPAQT